MNEKLRFLWLNLNQFVVYYDKPNTVNAVVAIGSKHKQLLIIRPEYRNEEKQIVAVIRYVTNMSKYTLLYGDSFTIDTWDHKIGNFEKSTVVNAVVQDPCNECDGILQCKDCRVFKNLYE